MNNPSRLSGNRIYLTSLRSDDEAIQAYMEWMGDEEALPFIGKNRDVITFNAEKEWAEKRRENEYIFNIVYRGDDKLIGNCSLRINGSNGWLGILIGERKYRNKGIGKEVLNLLIKWAFDELRMHRVGLNLSADNTRALKCYEGVGLRICGNEHEVSWSGGKWHDVFTMEMLEGEYRWQGNLNTELPDTALIS